MSKTTKIILSILTILVLTGACLAGVSVLTVRAAVNTVVDNVEKSPDEVADLVAEIAEIEIPAGFEPEFCSEVLGMQIASYRNGDEHTHLYIAQAPAYLMMDQDAMRDNVTTSAPTSNHDRGQRMVTISDTTTTIRGEEARIVISTGRNGEGREYQEMSVFFQGKNGTAMVSLSTPAEAWDQTLADELVASIQ